MSDALFHWYKSTKNSIKTCIENVDEDIPGAKIHLDALTQTIDTMDLACPDLKIRYEKLVAMQQSFTREQVDFICYEIGDWYLLWKNKIASGEHRLGFAKEQLKTMICGE